MCQPCYLSLQTTGNKYSNLLILIEYKKFNFFLFCFLITLKLLRKRHIGNDIVTIVFQEPGAQPFSPKNIRSQFQHVFIVVKVINPCTDNTQYR